MYTSDDIYKQLANNQYINIDYWPHIFGLLSRENKKVGYPITRLAPYQTVRALLMHTAYQFTIYLIYDWTILRKHSPFFLISLLCNTLYLVT